MQQAKEGNATLFSRWLVGQTWATFSPPVSLADVQTLYPGKQIELVQEPTENRARISACAKCAQVSRFGACGAPVKAGLTSQFELIKHPAGGAGCNSFVRVQSPRGISLLLRAAALGGVFYDADDIELLLRLIDAGDDLAGLETLIADAEAQVSKAGARNP